MAAIKDEITDYINRIKSFSKNSKIFLFSLSLTTISMGIFSVIFNLYILELGFSTASLGLLISSNLVASAVFLFPGGALCDRIGRKNTLLVSTTSKFVSIIILCTTTDFYLLLLANSTRGMGESLSKITVDPFMMEQSNQYERMHLFSFNAALRSFSRMIGSLIGGLLPAFFVFAVKGLHLQEQLAVQYQYTLLTAGIFVLSAFFPLFFIKEKKVTVEPSKRMEPLFSGRRSFVLKFTLCSIIIGLGAGIIVPYFNVYFSQVLYASSAEIGLMFSLGELSMGIASLVLPFLVRRFGKVGSLVLTQFLSIPFLLLIMVSRRLFPAFIGFFMRRTLMNVARPAEKNFYMGEIPEHERGKANSISQFGSTIFRAAGSDIGGHMIATGTFSHAFQMTATLYVVGTVLFYVFFRKKKE